MNKKIILNLLGKVSAGIGILMLLPLVLSLSYGENLWADYLMCIAVAGFICFQFRQYGWDAKMKEATVREWVASVVFGWLLAAGLSSLLYYSTGMLSPVDAFFESVSGLTTTGVTSIAHLEQLPKSIMLWRTMTGWFGGIASVVVFVAVLPQFAGSAVYLFNSEAKGNATVRVLPRVKDTAVAMLYIYVLLTIILTGILVAAGLSKFDAINHACSAISTTGFAMHNSNIAHADNIGMLLTLSFFMLLAGGNFALYYHVTQTGMKVLWKDLEFKIYLLGTVVITLLITGNIMYYNGYGLLDGLYSAFFQTTSFGSTTGFIATDYDNWPTFSKMLLGLLLVTGGSSCSAAGGLKVGRVIVLTKILFLELRRVLHPQLLLSVIYNGRSLPVTEMVNITRFFFVYVGTVVLISFGLAGAGLPPDEAFFGAASCVSNIGPAFGLLGDVNSYVGLPVATKLILCFGMLLGRLEIFIVMAMLRKEFWRKTKKW